MLAIVVSERDLSFSFHFGQEQPFINSFENLIWERKRQFDTNKFWLHSIALFLCNSSTSRPYTRIFSQIFLLRKGERLCGLVEGHGGMKCWVSEWNWLEESLLVRLEI